MSVPPFEGTYLVATGAGMCGLWQPERFEDVSDLGTWEDVVSDVDVLQRHIGEGSFVPLNVGGDGSFQIVVREGARSVREERYTVVSSDPYLLISRGTLSLGGLENIGPYVGGSHEIPIRAGRYAVRVHLVDWEAEPGSTTPTAGPLPDFVVEIHPEYGTEDDYRKSIFTFDKPSLSDQ
ncbi:hypothetical protein JOD54_003874 [Actinokineospora baliensis]|uniref:hypothetical protein n=1 Tax=Actinokineospora baliensis TaxID=547056 RepID=UPI00195D2B76|nr:hypothetical protein [Actinokineospora baliensis]MBM7773670.1 hypothetical protein [Actinokineospora baliensis]